MSQAPASIANERAGWFIVLLASICVGMSYGTLLTVTVFLTSLEAEFGWLRGQTSMAYMVAHIGAGIGGVLAGLWADRWSTRSVVLVGSIAMGAMYILLGTMQSLAEFYVFFGVLMGGMAVSAFLGPLLTSVGFWFDRNRGLAMSLTLSGQSVGGAVVPLAAGYFIHTMSWREAYISLGLIAWVLLIPLSFLLRDPPGLKEYKHAAWQLALAQAKQKHTVIIRPATLLTVMCLAGGGVCLCLTVPLVHLVPLLNGYGLDPKTANQVFGVMLFSGIPGRLILGKLSDRIGGLRMWLLAAGFPVLSLYGFMVVHTVPGLYVVAVLFGFGFAGVLPALPLIVRELIPAHLTGRSMGILLLAGYGALGTGGYIGGVLYDITGDYTATYTFGALVGLLSVAVTLGLHLYVERQKSRVAALKPAAAAA